VRGGKRALAVLGPPKKSTHPVDVGQRSEAAVLAAFVKHGYRVLTPFGVNHRYDFVLDLGDRFLRVQCKTGRLRDGVIRYGAHSTRANTRGTYWRRYSGEIDVFAVYCPDTGGTYVVPIEDGPSMQGSLRIDPPANGQSRRIRWAADYELPA
jgi:PD-(D/E)XK endonuclease